jgi:hypothetical protein
MRVPVAALAGLLIVGSAPGAARAATPDRLVVPLSDPARPAAIEASLVMGSIRVVAGRPGEVVIHAAAAGDREAERERDCEGCDAAGAGVAIAGSAREKDKHKGGKSRSGMRRIPNESFELSAEEEGNRVEIAAESWARAVDLRIEAPAGSSLQLSTVNDGELEVDGIAGELELSNTNGGITVRNARGPVNATTVNGDIEVVFSGALGSEPMAFSTLNGDVDLTLPAGAKFDVKLRSDNGEIYSDFDVVLTPKAARVEEGRGKGKYRVSIAKELTGKVGGGGPEIFLKTFNGDIVLRKGQ